MAERVWTSILKRSEFLHIRYQGQSFGRKGVVVQLAERSERLSRYRSGAKQDHLVGLGLVASKRVGNAVQRNRAKRRLRALADLILPDQHWLYTKSDQAMKQVDSKAKVRYDLVLIARADTCIRPWPLLQKDFLAALNHLHKKFKSNGSLI